jgi:hypothetical protein
MPDDGGRPHPGAVIGGRHGSPTVTLALPFSNITNVDSELRDAVADLAMLVAQLAAHTEAGEATEIAGVAQAAEELATHLSTRPGSP